MKVGATASRFSNVRRRRKLARLGLGLGFGLVSLAGSTGLADQAWWAGRVDTSWNSLGNWDTGESNGTPVAALPGIYTDVFFSTTTPTPANLFNGASSNFTINSLTFTAHSGMVEINSAGVTLTLAASGGAGITVQGGTLLRNIFGNILLAAPQTWTNNSPLGIVTLEINSPIDSVAPGGQITFAGTGTTTVSSLGSNITTGVIKNGRGVLYLGSSSTYSGGLTLNGGETIVASDTALGAAGNAVTLNAGAALSASAGYTFGAGRVVTVNGTAAAPSTLRIAAGASLVAGAAVLAGSGTLRVATTSTGSSTGKLDIQGANSGFTGQIVVGSQGQLIGDTYVPRNFDSPSTYTTLSLSNAGTLPNATSVSVDNSAMLKITQPAAAVTGRLGAATLNFHSGQFQYNASANGGASINDTFGNVTVTGNMVIAGSSVAGPAAGTTLNFGTLTRPDHGTVIFRAPLSGTQGSIGGAPSSTSTRIFFAGLTADTSTAGTTRSVVSWASTIAVLSGSDVIDNLMTYDANGFRPLNLATETTSTLTTGTNARLSASQNVPTGGIGINSLSIPTSVTLTGNGTDSSPGNVFTINSGALAVGGSLTLFNATVNFPSGGYLHLGATVNEMVSSRFTGAGGLTVAATGTGGQLAMTSAPTGGNTFTGGLSINGSASVSFRLNNQLGNDSSGKAAGDVVLAGGGLYYSPFSSSTVSLSDQGSNRAIRVDESGGTIVTTSTGTVRIPGTISGAGQLQFGGYNGTTDGVVELTNTAANTYAGGTVLRLGVLRISNPNQLGTGSLLFNGGTLQAAADLTFTSAPTLVGGAGIDTQGNNVILSAGISGSSGTASGIDATSVGVTKTGTGTLTFAGDSPSFAGQVWARVGRVLVNASLGSLTSVRADSTATVELGAADRISDSATLELAGGTLATDGFSETLSSLTISNGAVSTIDLGSGSSHLTLASSQFQSWFGTLHILNWDGNASGGGTDQIYFGTTASGLTTGQISHITFVNPTGYAPGTYAAKMLSTGELVTVVPEPGSCALALCGGIALAARRRRRAAQVRR